MYQDNQSKWQAGAVAAGLSTVLLLGLVLYVDNLRAGLKEIVDNTLPAARIVTGKPELQAKDMPGALKVLNDEKIIVINAVQGAVDDPEVNVTWDTAADHITAIGQNRRSIRVELRNTTKSLDTMARELVEAKASRDEARSLLARVEANRKMIAEKLSQANLSQRQEADFLELDREARRAATILRESGL